MVERKKSNELISEKKKKQPMALEQVVALVRVVICCSTSSDIWQLLVVLHPHRCFFFSRDILKVGICPLHTYYA